MRLYVIISMMTINGSQGETAGFPPREGSIPLLNRRNYLDPADDFGKLLLDFKYSVASGTFPTLSEQRKLICGVQHSDLASVEEMIESHRSMVAVVAYPFQRQGADPEDLLAEGTRTLVLFAKTFNGGDTAQFNDQAVSAMSKVFQENWPQIDTELFAVEKPMERVYQLAQTFTLPPAYWKVDELAEAGDIEQDTQVSSEDLGGLEAEELRVLEAIHLPGPEMESRLGVSSSYIVRKLASIRKKFKLEDSETREAIAVEALRRGAEFDTLPIPGIKTFSILERQVATRLVHKNKSIANQLDLSRTQLVHIINSLYKKTGARSRVELALVAHANDFEPSEDEVASSSKIYVEQLSATQADILKRALYMSDDEIADKLSETRANVSKTVQVAMAETGTTNRAGLVLELHRNGFTFDVIKPERPLTKILQPYEARIIKSMDKPYREITGDFRYDQSQIENTIFKAKKKVGARSREELALLLADIDLQSFDEQEVLKEKRRQELAQKLGTKTLSAHDIEVLLLTVPEEERKIISARYLGDTAVTWVTLSQRFGLHENILRRKADKTIAQLREVLGTSQ